MKLDEILVVDDDPRLRLLCEEALQIIGYSARLASNGSEAIEIIAAEQPAAVILDLFMPGVDGWGVLRALRERQIDVPVVLMTGAGDLHETPLDLYPIAGILPKPFDLDELLDAVEQVADPARRGLGLGSEQLASAQGGSAWQGRVLVGAPRSRN